MKAACPSCGAQVVGDPFDHHHEPIPGDVPLIDERGAVIDDEDGSPA